MKFPDRQPASVAPISLSSFSPVLRRLLRSTSRMQGYFVLVWFYDFVRPAVFECWAFGRAVGDRDSVVVF